MVTNRMLIGTHFFRLISWIALKYVGVCRQCEMESSTRVARRTLTWPSFNGSVIIYHEQINIFNSTIEMDTRAWF